jgi:hypothetical protein
VRLVSEVAGAMRLRHKELDNASSSSEPWSQIALAAEERGALSSS